MPDVREPGEYIQENGGFREPPADQRVANFPPILSDRPPRGVAGGNGGVRAGPDTSLRGLGKVVPTAILLGLLSSTRFWAQPTIEAAKTPLNQNPLTWLVQRLAVITRFWARANPHISHQVSKGAVHGSADFVHTLDLTALRIGQLAFTQAYIASDMAHAVQRLITHKIPEIVQRYLRPIRLRLGRVERLTGQALLQVRALRTHTNRELRRLQREQIDPLKKPVRVTLPGRITRVEGDVKRLKKTTALHTGRIKQLSFILVPALATAWLVKTLIRSGLRYVTCTNVKDVGNELCASPPGSGKRLGRWLRDLLALAPGALLLSDLCAWIGTLSVIARPFLDAIVEITGAAGAALCNGKYSAALPLPLETHALPPNPVGLPL